ncbi:MAG: 3-oxoacid CoA-transferase subunit B [Synergistaceae bacterium]|jgi:3-oxoacid CoA-transferase B subunit|nr:3-oxoacid CoA-transferase subunit B [Synergistaceae bacterium]
MFQMEEESAKIRIAQRIAREFTEMSRKRPLFVNLGVGIPTMVADYVRGNSLFLQAENGMLGVGPAAEPGKEDPFLINAGRVKVTETRGCAYFDSSVSFGMIRGGHIDATVIGAFEVDENGNVANWIIPNGKQLGVGGAMDLVAGANKVYIAMQHVTKKGEPKIISSCKLPVTGYAEVDVIVTEYALFRFVEGKMVLEEIAPEITLEELKTVTTAKYVVSDNLGKLA